MLVRAYSDDSDDRLLAELQPRFIIMYEPSHEFIRRIEVRLVNEVLARLSSTYNRCIKKKRDINTVKF